MVEQMHINGLGNVSLQWFIAGAVAPVPTAASENGSNAATEEEEEKEDDQCKKRQAVPSAPGRRYHNVDVITKKIKELAQTNEEVYANAMVMPQLDQILNKATMFLHTSS